MCPSNKFAHSLRYSTTWESCISLTRRTIGHLTECSHRTQYALKCHVAGLTSFWHLLRLEKKPPSDSTTKRTTISLTTDTWLRKVMPAVETIRNSSDKLVVKPGLYVCVDEMMVKFTGQNAGTFRIKNKPIGEGYKLFEFADSETGYVLYFTPDVRLSGCSGLNEFSPANKDGCTLA